LWESRVFSSLAGSSPSQRIQRTPYPQRPSAISAYLDFLALERNVAPATQHQALNARVFLVKNVFGIPDFTLDHFTPARGQRRPPVVMTREEVRSVFAHLEDPWKLSAQVMYGSGLRLMEAMRLRVQDFDFGQGTITIHDGKGGKHRVVTLPRALEERLKHHLSALQEKHLSDHERPVITRTNSIGWDLDCRKFCGLTP
jgi:integrase